MTPSRSSTDRVAHRHPDVIDEVDGVPSTHTPPTAEHDRMVTTMPGSAAPLPFDAPFSIGATPAVTGMALAVLGTTSVAVLKLYDGHPNRFQILAGLLALVAVECLVLSLVAALRRGRLTSGADSFGTTWACNEWEHAGCPNAFGHDATLLDRPSAPGGRETR